MRQVFERSVKSRLFGLRALQGGHGGPIQAVAACWQGYCRVCAGALQRGQAVRIKGVGAVFPLGTQGQYSSTLSCFDQAFLRKCQLNPSKSLPVHETKSQGTHQIANAEVSQWCALPPGVCGQVIEAVISSACDMLQSGDIEQISMQPLGSLVVGRQRQAIFRPAHDLFSARQMHPDDVGESMWTPHESGEQHPRADAHRYITM